MAHTRGAAALCWPVGGAVASPPPGPLGDSGVLGFGGLGARQQGDGGVVCVVVPLGEVGALSQLEEHRQLAAPHVHGARVHQEQGLCCVVHQLLSWGAGASQGAGGWAVGVRAVGAGSACSPESGVLLSASRDRGGSWGDRSSWICWGRKHSEGSHGPPSLPPAGPFSPPPTPLYARRPGCCQGRAGSRRAWALRG